MKLKQMTNPLVAKKRLLRMLVIFFIALLLPIYLLLDRVYSQLENEAYFNQRRQAVSLVESIEQQLLRLLEKEQERPIAEYSFFNLLESSLLQSSGLKFSPLASMPPKTNIPGLTGYFQIDRDGAFQIPALPEVKTRQTNLSQQELSRRLVLKDKLRQLLSVNVLEENKPLTGKKNDQGFNDSVENKEVRSSASQVYQITPDLQLADKDQVLQIKEMADDRVRLKVKKKPKTEIFRTNVPEKSQILSEETLQALNIDNTRYKQKPTSNDTSSSLGKIKSKFRSRQELVKLPEQSVASRFFNRPELKMAHDLNPRAKQLSEPNNAESESDQLMSSSIVDSPTISANDQILPIKILSFESEVGALQLIELNPTYFCFFRRVWYDKNPYIQGFIVNQLDFINAIIQPFINGNQAEPFSSLLVSYNGKLKRQYKRINTNKESLIFRTSLSSPVQALEIIVNSASISAGSGSDVVNILALSLASVLILGLLGFYKIGSSQIELAAKQRNFISAVSHELKTPLTSIRMYSEMLRSDWVEDEARKITYYDFIFFESERLSRLINNVLQLARLDYQADKFELLAVSPALVLKEVGEKVSSQIDASGFKLKIIGNHAPTDCLINIDKDTFLQIMINLVDNAIKFSSSAENKIINLGYKINTTNQQVIFFVRDFGPGIEKKQMKKIFQLFYRSGDELTRTQPGTGIGLALIVQLSERMDLKVNVVNCSPGAEFQIICQSLEEGA